MFLLYKAISVHIVYFIFAKECYFAGKTYKCVNLSFLPFLVPRFTQYTNMCNDAYARWCVSVKEVEPLYNTVQTCVIAIILCMTSFVVCIASHLNYMDRPKLEIHHGRKRLARKLQVK